MPSRQALRLVAALAVPFTMATQSGAQTMTRETSLDAKQKSVVTIAAFTASGDLDRLKPALNRGLDSGLTVNEIKDVLVQMYAYAGFPRSLNGLSVFMAVLEERKARGITDDVGREASPLPANLDRDAYGARVRAELSGLEEIPPPAAWQEFAPAADRFLKEHLFADIFARDVLDHRTRELATIAALANMTGTAGQLKFHLGAAMNTGLTEAQMRDFIEVLGDGVGHEQGAKAEKVLTTVLSERRTP